MVFARLGPTPFSRGSTTADSTSLWTRGLPSSSSSSSITSKTFRGRRCHSRGRGGVQCCPSRVCTAHAAGRVIRDCLAAARLCRYAFSSRRDAADHRCRYAASAVVFRSIATVGDTACCMFADAGVISLFHRGRRLDDVAITITGGDTDPADVQDCLLYTSPSPRD